MLQHNHFIRSFSRRIKAICMTALLIFFTCSSQTIQAQKEPLKSAAAETAVHEPTAVELLASARTIYVKSNSVWVKRKAIEDALLKNKSFIALGYSVSKDLSEADLKLEVDHSPLTLRYPFTVTHTRTQIVVASGTVISLRILNDVPGDTASSFVKQVKAARAAVANKKNESAANKN
jgi:hypothetical protein